MKRPLLYLLLALPASASMSLGQDRFSMRRGGGGGGPPSTNEKPSESTPRARPMTEPYTVLLTTSIFARDRRTGSLPPTGPTEPPVNPESYFTFRGAAVGDDGQVVGFIEDTRNSSTLKVKVGDTLASGRVTAISLDSLDYARSNGLSKLHVDLGFNLLGREMSVSPTDSSSSAASAPSGGPPINDLNNWRGQRNFGGQGGPGGGFDRRSFRGGPDGGGGGRSFDNGGDPNGRRSRRDNGGG